MNDANYITHLNNSLGSFFDLSLLYFRMPVSESESSSVIMLAAEIFDLAVGLDLTTTVWLLISRFELPDSCSTSNVAFDGSAAATFFDIT